MLERLAGNTALKSELGAALGAGRLPHAILLVGEPGCGAGFAARCLAADYLYPQGGPHAEAVLKKEDTECLVLQGEGASGQIAVKRVREMREAIQRSALSTDAAGRVLFIYGAQNLNGSSANAMLKIIEEPPEGVLFVLTATSAAECAALLTREGLPARLAQELAFLYEGHIGTALQAFRNDTFKAALGLAKELCSYAAQNDTYRTLVLVTKYERDRESFLALLWQLDQLCSAVLRRPAYGAAGPRRADLTSQRCNAQNRNRQRQPAPGGGGICRRDCPVKPCTNGIFALQIDKGTSHESNFCKIQGKRPLLLF